MNTITYKLKQLKQLTQNRQVTFRERSGCSAISTTVAGVSSMGTTWVNIQLVKTHGVGSKHRGLLVRGKMSKQ